MHRDASAAGSVGQFTPPGEAVYGQLQITANRHYALTHAQWYKWDRVKSQVVTAGPSVDMTQGLTPS